MSESLEQFEATERELMRHQMNVRGQAYYGETMPVEILPVSLDRKSDAFLFSRDSIRIDETRQQRQADVGSPPEFPRPSVIAHTAAETEEIISTATEATAGAIRIDKSGKHQEEMADSELTPASTSPPISTAVDTVAIESKMSTPAIPIEAPIVEASRSPIRINESSKQEEVMVDSRSPSAPRTLTDITTPGTTATTRTSTPTISPAIDKPTFDSTTTCINESGEQQEEIIDSELAPASASPPVTTAVGTVTIGSNLMSTPAIPIVEVDSSSIHVNESGKQEVMVDSRAPPASPTLPDVPAVETSTIRSTSTPEPTLVISEPAIEVCNNIIRVNEAGGQQEEDMVSSESPPVPAILAEVLPALERTASTSTPTLTETPADEPLFEAYGMAIRIGESLEQQEEMSHSKSTPAAPAEIPPIEKATTSAMTPVIGTEEKPAEEVPCLLVPLVCIERLSHPLAVSPLRSESRRP